MMRETKAVRGRPASSSHANGAPAAPLVSWLLCRAGEVLCALPAEHVAEIMRVLPLERLADAPDCVLGVSVIRGAPTPVVDLGFIIAGKATPSTRLVAVRSGERIIALAVDAVVGPTALPADMAGRLPPLLADAAERIGAIGALDSELMVFLRVGRLVPQDVLAGLDIAGAAT